jgi:hypothetical protein
MRDELTDIILTKEMLDKMYGVNTEEYYDELEMIKRDGYYYTKHRKIKGDSDFVAWRWHRYLKVYKFRERVSIFWDRLKRKFRKSKTITYKINIESGFASEKDFQKFANEMKKQSEERMRSYQ